MRTLFTCWARPSMLAVAVSSPDQHMRDKAVRGQRVSQQTVHLRGCKALEEGAGSESD